MKKQLTAMIVALVLLSSCSAPKKVLDENGNLSSVMAEKQFEIEINAVEPMLTQAMGQVLTSGLMMPGNSVGRIDLQGAGYYIRVKGDSVAANLPYYGERQMGGGYNDDPGIQFNSVPKELKIEEIPDKNTYRVTFTVAETTETFQVNGTISKNESASFNIQSSHRNRIRYTGTLNRLAKEDAAANQ